MNVASIDRKFDELPIALIDEPQLPSRSAMDDTKLDELVSSIRANGLIQPISVARNGERYEVIAGHRRRIASGRAGLEKIPCLIYPTRDDALDAIQFAENRHREELSAADEAIWFSELLERKCDGDIEKLCILVGEKLNYVDNRLALFHGDPEVFGALQSGQIKIGVAHELNKITDQQYRHYYLTWACRDGATIATVAGWVQQWKTCIADVPAVPVVETPEPTIVANSAYDPHRCYVCGKSDPRHIPQIVYVHSHCQLAILDPLLEAATRGNPSTE